MRTAKMAFCLAFLICSAFRSTQAEPGSIRFSLGTNIWGNTLGAEYQLKLGKTWALGMMYSSGYFSLVKNETGDFLLPKDVPGEEHRVTLELKQLIDLSVYYARDPNGKTRYLDEFAIGLTHAFFRFRSEFTEVGTPGTFRAQRDYSRYGLFLSCNIVRRELESQKKTFLLFGIRSKFIVLHSPQDIDYDNGAGEIKHSRLFSRHGDYMFFAYPEVFTALSLGL
jgi:hypothetical protein